MEWKEERETTIAHPIPDEGEDISLQRTNERRLSLLAAGCGGECINGPVQLVHGMKYQLASWWLAACVLRRS